MRQRWLGGVLAAAVLVAMAMAGLSARTPQNAPPDKGAALLDEVKALRADVREAAANSLRAQLLVARLSLQEQRITALNRELGEVQTRIMAATDERSSVEGQLRELEQALTGGAVAPDLQREIQAQRIAVQRALAQHQQVEQQLRLRESEIMGVITGEQGRWNYFNARLDELERSLSAGARR